MTDISIDLDRFLDIQICVSCSLLLLWLHVLFSSVTFVLYIVVWAQKKKKLQDVMNAILVVATSAFHIYPLQSFVKNSNQQKPGKWV